MKIGIKYDHYLEDAGLLLWALNDAQVNADFKHTGIFSKDNLGRVFELIFNDNFFKFSKRDEDLIDCDKRINIVWSSPSDNSHYDKELCIISDVVMDHLTNDYMREYLDKGNIFLSISTSNVTHKNFIYNPLLGVVLYYYELGLNYINYLIELQVQVPNHLPNGAPSITAICQSVFDSVTYLKNLKSTLGSDEAVYNTLMEKYGHHLKENVRLFKQLEQICPVKDRLINAILN
jgi:hypothetical protein